MKKHNLYVYPNAKKHVHDETEKYYNSVPMSEKGIKDYFVLTSPDNAEYFYMGQVSDDMNVQESNFEFYKDNKAKHICDIEGDWCQKKIPKWLYGATLSINSVKKEYVENKIKMFIRPTFSHLFMEIIKNDMKLKFNFNDNLGFGFKGLADPLGVRNKVRLACNSSAEITSDFEFNSMWASKSSAGSRLRKEYCFKMVKNTFSLCPRGTGMDTPRFFESCFFSRIPVFVSHSPYIFGRSYNMESPFYFYIDASSSVEEITQKLIEIKNTDVNLLREMSHNAKMFFETKVRDYFDDPTGNFLRWIENEK
jgi:hypothetical protein